MVIYKKKKKGGGGFGIITIRSVLTFLISFTRILTTNRSSRLFFRSLNLKLKKYTLGFFCLFQNYDPFNCNGNIIINVLLFKANHKTYKQINF